MSNLHLILLHLLLLGGSSSVAATCFSLPRTPSRPRRSNSASTTSAHKKSSSSINSNSSDENVDIMSSKKDRIIHWGIVGLGDVCAVKSGPAFYKCRGSTLSAVMRRTPGAAREWIENNGDSLPRDVARSIRAFDGVERMMEETAESDRPLDAVYVASPPGSHLENVRQIVAGLGPSSSLKAVYVEKPCGRCAWETRAMAEELRARNVEFYPAYVSRAHERTRVLRKLLSVDKVCGERVTNIKYTQRGSSFARGLDGGGIPWRLNAERSGGGLIMDMGCHVLDRIDYLFGPLRDVEGTVLREGAAGRDSYPLTEDYVAASATVGECDWSAVPSAGATVECVWDFSLAGRGGDVDELVVSGPGGSVSMAAMGAGLPMNVMDADGGLVETLEFDPPAHAAQPLIQSIVSELLGDEEDDENHRSARSPARADNAVRTSEVLDAILGSYYGGRHDEFWTRPETWPGLKPTPSNCP